MRVGKSVLPFFPDILNIGAAHLSTSSPNTRFWKCRCRNHPTVFAERIFNQQADIESEWINRQLRVFILRYTWGKILFCCFHINHLLASYTVLVYQ